MNFFQKNAHWLIAAAMIVLTAGLGYLPEQHEFGKIMAFYVPLFALYLLSLQLTTDNPQLTTDNPQLTTDNPQLTT
ncbi:MAG: hypothetical protein ACE5FF_17925, partial [Saprospiraceae bacterium]